MQGSADEKQHERGRVVGQDRRQGAAGSLWPRSSGTASDATNTVAIIAEAGEVSSAWPGRRHAGTAGRSTEIEGGRPRRRPRPRHATGSAAAPGFSRTARPVTGGDSCCSLDLTVPSAPKMAAGHGDCTGAGDGMTWRYGGRSPKTTVMFGIRRDFFRLAPTVGA